MPLTCELNHLNCLSPFTHLDASNCNKYFCLRHLPSPEASSLRLTRLPSQSIFIHNENRPNVKSKQEKDENIRAGKQRVEGNLREIVISDWATYIN